MPRHRQLKSQMIHHPSKKSRLVEYRLYGNRRKMKIVLSSLTQLNKEGNLI